MRNGRGSILLVTVLLALVAASIAYVAISGALSVEQQERQRRDVVSAARDAESLHRRMLSELEIDPLAHLRRVLDGELPRRCGPSGEQVGPGEPWPEACGTPWSYDIGPEGGTLVLPHGSTGEEQPMRLVTMIPTAHGTVAYETIIQHGRSRPTLHSEEGFDVADLDLTGTRAGIVLSSHGVITTTTLDPLGSGPALIASAEAASPPEPPAGGVTLITGSSALHATGSSGPGGVEAAHEQSMRIACLSLCIIPGGEMVGQEGAILQVPVEADAIRIRPRGTLLDVAYSTAGLREPDDEGWQPVGTVESPPLGIVRVDADLLIAGCRSGGPAGCGAIGGSLTILAGTAGRSATAWIEGEIEQTTGRSGLSVRGDVLHLGGDARLSVNVIGGTLSGQGALQGAHHIAALPDGGITFVRDTEAERTPPPLMPGADYTPLRISGRLLDPQSALQIIGGLRQAPGQVSTTPGQASVLSVDSAPGGAQVQYAIGRTGAGPVTSMQYSTDGGETWTDAAWRDGTLRVPVLDPHATVQVRIRALNTAGAGPGSLPAQAAS